MFYEKIDYNRIPELAKKMETFFCRGKSIQTTAFLGGYSSDISFFVMMSQAYAETALNLLDQCLNDNIDKKADTWIFPILHCMLHSIELGLKATNYLLESLLGLQPKIEKHHKIKKVCDKTVSYLKQAKTQDFNCGCDEIITASKLIKKFIANICEKTNNEEDDMSFTRYPFDSNNEKMFYSHLTSHEVIDLEKLREQFCYTYMMVDLILTAIYQDDFPEIKITPERKFSLY